MAVTRVEKETPWCTIILVTGTLISHTLVLRGNLATSAAMHQLGTSTGGWSSVGIQLSESLTTELDATMSNVSDVLTQAITALLQVETAIDSLLGLSGAVTDSSLAQYVAEALKNSTNASNKALVAFAQFRASPAAQATKGHSRTPPTGTRPMLLGPASTFLEEEVVFMAQAPQPIISAPHPAFMSWSSGSGACIGAKTSRLPDWNNINVNNITDVIVEQAMRIVMENRRSLNASISSLGVPTPEEFTIALKLMITDLVKDFAGRATVTFHQFVQYIKPALVQIGKWLVSFSTSTSSIVEGFSSSLDKIQKIFDQIMSKLSQSSGSNQLVMEYETYNLFDASNTGFISLQDLKDVSTMYTITALQGQKSAELFEKYDTDHDGKMSKDDFHLFVQDESVPGIMTLVLRTYSNKLAVISGNLAAGVMRDEVAGAVCDYLSLVAAKNMTKIDWVSQALTNDSLPLEFSADVLKNLALNLDSPDVLTTVDVGALVVSEMSRLNATHMARLLELLANPEFFVSEGFDTQDQPVVVQRVTQWVAQSQYGAKVLGTTVAALLQAAPAAEAGLTGGALEAMPMRLRLQVEERQRLFARSRLAARRQRLAQRRLTRSSQDLRHRLLGGPQASDSLSSYQQQVVNSGVRALPETLKFASWLASNASGTVATFLDECFVYSSESSNVLESFANQVLAMISKVQSFMDLMQEYATPTGIAQFEKQVEDFGKSAVDDILSVLLPRVDAVMAAVARRLPNSTLAATQREAFVAEALQKAVMRFDARAAGVMSLAEANPAGLSSIWSEITTLLSNLETALPTVVSDLKFARKEVSAVSSSLDSIFSIFDQRGPPLFYTIAKLYKTMWVIYFTLFAVLTCSVLFYGFWASGFCGGPKAAVSTSEEQFEGPRTFRERCATCCRCCCACLTGCSDSHLCFWSVILLLQIIVLVLFVVSIVLCLLAGVQAFISSGCAEVYLLSDKSICTGVLGTLRTWLLSFLTNDSALIEEACEKKDLLTCELISSRLSSSAMYTIVGSLLAAVLSFQMIVESAVQHERARWRRIFDEASKRV